MWGGCSHERASAILCRLPKMVARTFSFPFCYRSSTHAPTERGGRGPQPPAYEGAGNRSQDGIRRGKLKEGKEGGWGGKEVGVSRKDALASTRPIRPWLYAMALSYGRERQEGIEGGKNGGQRKRHAAFGRGQRRGQGCAWGAGKSSLHSSPTSPPPHTHTPLFRPPCNPALTFPTEVANLQECK